MTDPVHKHHRPQSTRRNTMCSHQPECPPAEAPDHERARVLASFPEQGWSLLCNGVIVFDDTGELLPDGRPVAPHRGPAPHVVRPTLRAA
jgi:hypothetical protein